MIKKPMFLRRRRVNSRAVALSIHPRSTPTPYAVNPKPVAAMLEAERTAPF